MMAAQRTKCLLKFCSQWGRTLNSATVKVPRDSYSQQKVLLSQQLRTLCTKHDPGRSEVTGEDAEDKNVDIGSVFRRIQQEAGINAAPSTAPSQILSTEELNILQADFKALASDWKELHQVLDGHDMSGLALLMFVEENIKDAPYSVLCKLVGSFSKVFGSDSRQFQLLLDEGMRRMSDESLIQALFFVNVLNQLPEDKVPSKYFELCLEKVKVKLTPTIMGMELVFALSVLRRNKMPELQDMLDNLIIETLPGMSTENVLDVFHIKAIDRHRNPAVIRNIVSRLNSSDLGGVSIAALKNLFYSCATLSVYNPHLLLKLSKQTTVELQKIKYSLPVKGTLAHSILFSCKTLHWKEQELVNEFSNILKHDMERRNPKDLAEDIISLCYLGTKRMDLLTSFYNKSEKLRETQPLCWLQYVHSKASIQMGKLEEVQKALDPEFYQPLLQEGGSDYTKKLLLNLQGCLELDLGIKDRPLKQAKEWLDEMQVTRGKNSLAYAVESALKLVSTDISGPRFDKYGHRIDFDVQFRLSGNPEDMARAAIRILDFNEMVQGNEKGAVFATGPAAMATRHLKAQDTPVLILPYYKWKSFEMSIQNAARLETMLKETYKASREAKDAENIQASSESKTQASA